MSEELQVFSIVFGFLVAVVVSWSIGWWRGFRRGEMSASESIRAAERRLDRRMQEMERPTRPSKYEQEVLDRRNEATYQHIMESKGWFDPDGEPEEGWMYEVIHNGFGHTIDIVRSPEPDLGEI